MPPAAPSQPSATPPAPGSNPPAPPNPQGDAPAAPPAPTPPAADAPAFDATKLTTDQLKAVLENQELWNLPRMKEIREAASKLKEADTAAEKAANDKLVADKKFQELSEKQATTITGLEEKIQTMTVNQALTNKLVKENVVDLDGALKLIDRSTLKVDDNGTVQGIDDALAGLKKDRSYLFTADGSNPPQPTVGTPSNPAAASGSGKFKFKESQLTPAFYNEHKAEIDEAGRLGLIEPDGPPHA